MPNNASFSKTSLLHAVGAVVILLAAGALWRAGREAGQTEQAKVAEASSTPQPAARAVAKTAQAAAPSGRQFDAFQVRPFAVAKSSGGHEWTAEDGREPDAILDIAHNEAEVQRLMEENPRIKRRQLVYRKEPAYVTVQRARAAGEPVRKLIVPGLDGREVEMEVVNADLSPSGLSGTFSGRIPGLGVSMVTLAFKEGREAFSVMSPEDGTFLQGHPREPGEIIVTSYDPDKYQPMPGGEPIKVAGPLKDRR